MTDEAQFFKISRNLRRRGTTLRRLVLSTAPTHLLPLTAEHGGAVAKSDFLCLAHFSLDKRDDIG
jgi:hypothetical protein